MSSKLLKIFKKDKKNKKINNEIKQDSEKLASYYDTDKKKYVITKIPKYMNIINNKNSIKQPSKLENIAGVFLDINDKTEKDSFNKYKSDDGTQVSVNLLENIIKENTDINTDTDTSYDSFFDTDLYSNFSDEEEDINSSVSSNISENNSSSIYDLDTSFRQDTKLISNKQKNGISNQQFYDQNDNQNDDVNYDPNSIDSDVESKIEEDVNKDDRGSVVSERSNIFSSRYRNRPKNKNNNYLEPSELMYIPSEN